MADQTIEKTPMAGTSVNRPESGTYGEKAAINDLKADLPPMDAEGMGAATGGPAPMPQPDTQLPGAPGRPIQGPPGVPPVLLGGGNAPSPMDQPNNPMSSPEAARVSLLEQLVSSPEVSETTKQWAQIVLEALRG